MVEDTHETIVENVTPGMTQKQRAEFMKHMPQICEAKALNGAIRTALHIKGTYTLEELKKPFVVAYLVPNLNHEEVKRAAIDSMFQASKNLFGEAYTPSVQQIESKVPEQAAIEASDGKDYDKYIDGSYQEEAAGYNEETQLQGTGQTMEEEDRSRDFCCDKCGEQVSRKVWDYSVERFDRPLCYKCQKIVRDGQRRA